MKQHATRTAAAFGTCQNPICHFGRFSTLPAQAKNVCERMSSAARAAMGERYGRALLVLPPAPARNGMNNKGACRPPGACCRRRPPHVVAAAAAECRRTLQLSSCAIAHCSTMPTSSTARKPKEGCCWPRARLHTRAAQPASLGSAATVSRGAAWWALQEANTPTRRRAQSADFHGFSNRG